MDTQTPALDEERLTELVEEIGEEELSDVLMIFLEEAEHEASAIALGLDDTAFARSTHMLRSGGLNLGFAALVQAAETAAQTPKEDHNSLGQMLSGVIARSRSAVLARVG